jgi:hypothetical protein
VTSLGIDPETSRLAAQCLNHYANPGPRFKYDRNDLYVNKSQFVPVIFEPPCTNLLIIRIAPFSTSAEKTSCVNSSTIIQNRAIFYGETSLPPDEIRSCAWYKTMNKSEASPTTGTTTSRKILTAGLIKIRVFSGVTPRGVFSSWWRLECSANLRNSQHDITGRN